MRLLAGAVKLLEGALRLYSVTVDCDMVAFVTDSTDVTVTMGWSLHLLTGMIRKRIRVRGIVQGVGFRPFVYRLAVAKRLSGYVTNSTAGVIIEIEGPAGSIEGFIDDFRGEMPALAQVDTFEVENIPLVGEHEFSIRESEAETGEFVLVPPDIATCYECLKDFTDPANRRYLYPFTNCTNCGPRYTIIEDIPYDRPATTMARFPMCAACRREYEDPADRRFHAQPNACPECGPWLELRSAGAMVVERHEALRQTRALLHAGHILAIKGLGGFHLACDATNASAVRLLRVRKRRSDKPFALMARGIEQIRQFCRVSDEERAALLSSRRPIVILERRPDATLPSDVAPGNNTVGFMLPYTPLHHLLFGDGPRADAEFAALVMTSGNISEEPIVSRNEEVETRLYGLADHFLFHNRPIRTRVDDSVLRVFAGGTRLLRRSRGYAPHPVDLGIPVAQVLATGGELKNTLCLTKDHYAILSQHIGDLENLETLEFFEETLAHMKRFFRVEPAVVAHDLHPGYLSTRAALAMGLTTVGIQHHYAHIASCMAENHLREKVIGVAFDGTGYGTDGQIWGGEFLVCDYADFERRAHFRYVPMAGADMAIREPWRMAVAYLRDAGLPLALPVVPEKKIRFVASMIERGVQTIQTSSCGRMFDAVAALIGLRQETNFEGQAAIELENLAAPVVGSPYPFEVTAGSSPIMIDMRSAIVQIVAELHAGESPSVIAARFHETIAAVVVDICRRVQASDGLSRVCLSGGTFQNRLLTERCQRLLTERGFEVFLHAHVPPNDGGIALGQAVIASHKLHR